VSGPAQLAPGRRYTLRVRAVNGSVVLRGASIAHEGHWDDPVPIRLPGFDPYEAMYQVSGLEVVWEDQVGKRQRMQDILDGTEYLVISSNRFYASLNRNPRRWPMTIEYYRALFSSALGFELIADFTSPPCLGSICVDDQEAEEAFTVYDHPRVMVFHKTAAYSADQTAKILRRVDLTQVKRLPAIKVADPPAALPIPPPLNKPG
jgi:hypothetical protein